MRGEIIIGHRDRERRISGSAKRVKISGGDVAPSPWALHLGYYAEVSGSGQSDDDGNHERQH